MASPTNLIADAFEKLNRTISAEDAHKFASTDLEGVWNAVRDIQNIQRKRQSVQNLRRIEPFLKSLEKYSKVIEVLCNGTPFMPYAWVSSFQDNMQWDLLTFDRLLLSLCYRLVYPYSLS
jgi:hypothetical protein